MRDLPTPRAIFGRIAADLAVSSCEFLLVITPNQPSPEKFLSIVQAIYMPLIPVFGGLLAVITRTEVYNTKTLMFKWVVSIGAGDYGRPPVHSS